MDEDMELRAIRERKLRELMERTHSPIAERDKGALTSNKPSEITDETFSKMVQSQDLLVVDCWAPWCGPCRIISPILEEMSQDYAGKIFFGKLNVDENPKVAEQYRIMSIPTLLVFKNGKLVDRIVGAMPRHALEPKITRYL